MYETALICDGAVAPDQNVVRDCLSEDLDFEHVSDDFLRFAIDIRMNKGDIVVAGDNISQRGETLIDALDCDCIGERVAKMLEFLVARGRWNQKPVSVPCKQSILQYLFAGNFYS